MMTDVATVTSQVTAKQAVGAKSAGASAGTGTVLDGAFAALLGTAGKTPADREAAKDGDGATDGKAAQPVIDPALIGADANPGAAAGSGVTGETGEAQAVTGDIDPTTAKPRKDVARKGDDGLLQAQAALAGMAMPVQDVPGAQPKPATPAMADGVASVGADLTKTNPAAALAATTVQALAGKDSKDGKADKPAGDSGKILSSVENPAMARAATPAQAAVASNASHQQGDQPADGHGQPADRRSGDTGDKAADQTLTVADTSAPAVTADPLRDIVQSLPPVVQSQLSAVGAARPASTGEVLSNQVIDMSVSGQWIDRMAREIATVADGSGHTQFQLNPPNLGRIQIDLWRGDDQMNVRLLAETDEAARRLREGQAGLEAHARVASLSLGSVSVEKSSAPFESGDRQNQRQGAEQNGTANQQSFAQAQGQSAQGRNNNSGGNLNRSGASAVIGSERQAEPAQDARTTRAGDPRVRFA